MRLCAGLYVTFSSAMIGKGCSLLASLRFDALYERRSHHQLRDGHISIEIRYHDQNSPSVWREKEFCIKKNVRGILLRVVLRVDYIYSILIFNFISFFIYCKCNTFFSNKIIYKILEEKCLCKTPPQYLRWLPLANGIINLT